MKFNMPRLGPFMTFGFTKAAGIRPCKDGYVHGGGGGGGAAAGLADSTIRMVQWMDEDGMAPDWLKEIDWWTWDGSKLTQDEMDRLQEPFDKFILTKNSAEFSEETVKRGIMGCSVNNSKDICEDHHLKARDFWVNVEHPEVGDTLTYCGPFIKLSEAPMKIFRRAPLIGEHNEEIYEKEIGLSRRELILLKQGGVI